MKLSRREIILLSALLIVGSIYLFYQYLYQPLQRDTNALVAENARIKEAIEMQTSKMEAATKLQKEQEKLEEEYRQLMVAVPEDAYIPEIIAWLEKSAQDASVRLDKVSYQGSGDNEKDRENIKTAARACNFEISAGGSYFNLMSFLLNIEKSPRIYVISAGQLNTQQKKQETTVPVVSEEEDGAMPAPELLKGAAAYDSNNLVLNLKLSAYYDKDKKADISGMAEKVPIGEGRENPF